MMKIVYPIAVAITLFCSVWFVASLIDTDTHNDICSSSYGEYADWNMFELLSN